MSEIVDLYNKSKLQEMIRGQRMNGHALRFHVGRYRTSCITTRNTCCFLATSSSSAQNIWDIKCTGLTAGTYASHRLWRIALTVKLHELQRTLVVLQTPAKSHRKTQHTHTHTHTQRVAHARKYCTCTKYVHKTANVVFSVSCDFPPQRISFNISIQPCTSRS